MSKLKINNLVAIYHGYAGIPDECGHVYTTIKDWFYAKETFLKMALRWLGKEYTLEKNNL